jgi:hypothetical protein
MTIQCGQRPTTAAPHCSCHERAASMSEQARSTCALASAALPRRCRRMRIGKPGGALSRSNSGRAPAWSFHPVSAVQNAFSTSYPAGATSRHTWSRRLLVPSGCCTTGGCEAAPSQGVRQNSCPPGDRMTAEANFEATSVAPSPWAWSMASGTSLTSRSRCAPPGPRTPWSFREGCPEDGSKVANSLAKRCLPAAGPPVKSPPTRTWRRRRPPRRHPRIRQLPTPGHLRGSREPGAPVGWTPPATVPTDPWVASGARSGRRSGTPKGSHRRG